MWGGRPWRGEQERVAARVRELLGDAAPSHVADSGPEAGAVGAQHRSVPRWEPSRAAVVSLGVLLAVVIAATAWWYWSAQAPAVSVAASGPVSAPSLSGSVAAPPSPSPSSVASGFIVVDVAGKVRHPGVYRLAVGARIDDAVRAAGGVEAGVSTVSLNLAAPLHDGDQVVVGVAGAAPAPAAGGVSGASATVDLNTATAAQLDALPGVGPVLAQHIIDWRVAHGGFTSVEQLQNVSGIGDAKFADLRGLVST